MFSEDFREVELGFPRVAACHQNPQAGVPGTMEKASFPQLVVARILSKRGREYGAGHEVLHAVVAESQGVALAIAFKPLPKGGVGVAGLIDSRLKGEEREFHRVESPLTHQLEFLPGGKRRQRCGIFHGQIIRQRPEDPVVLRNLGVSRGLTLGGGRISCRFGLGRWSGRWSLRRRRLGLGGSRGGGLRRLLCQRWMQYPKCTNHYREAYHTVGPRGSVNHSLRNLPIYL